MILLTTVVCDLKGVYIIPVQHSRRYEVESLDCVYINHFYGGVCYIFSNEMVMNVKGTLVSRFHDTIVSFPIGNENLDPVQQPC